MSCVTVKNGLNSAVTAIKKPQLRLCCFKNKMGFTNYLDIAKKKQYIDLNFKNMKYGCII